MNATDSNTAENDQRERNGRSGSLVEMRGVIIVEQRVPFGIVVALVFITLYPSRVGQPNRKATFAYLLTVSLLAILTVSIFLPRGVYATDYTLDVNDTGMVCENVLGGVWDNTQYPLCTLFPKNYAILPTDSLVINSGVTVVQNAQNGLTTNGPVTNNGEIDIGGTLYVANQSGNFGVIKNYGDISIQRPFGDLNNEVGGTFTNIGSIEDSGGLGNRAQMTNSGSISVEGIMTNSGSGSIIDNSGSLIVASSANGLFNGGTIVNTGTIENDGFIDNSNGTIIEACGGTLSGSGTIKGNQPTNECQTVNTSTTLPPPTLSSDWAVSSVAVDPSNPTAGTSVTFTMTMDLLSTTGTLPQTVNVQCQLDGQSCGAGSVTYPGPVGQPMNVQTDTAWVATPGTHTLTWSIDPTNDPTPADNMMSMSFTVQPQSNSQNPSTTTSSTTGSTAPSSNTQIVTVTATQQPSSTSSFSQAALQPGPLDLLQQNSILLIVALGLLVIVLGFALMRRGRTTSPATPVTTSTTQPSSQSSKQSLFCVECGAENQTGNKFCRKCGQALA